MSLLMVGGLFLLAIISGMLGLGVAFAAVPFLGLFMPDLVHQVQPVSLLLNGLTAIFAALGFAMGGHIDWRKAGILSIVTTLSAPLGAYLVQTATPAYVWYAYLASVIFLAYKLFRKTTSGIVEENLKLACLFAVPISILSGFLGVGPGFLLMPTLIILGFEAKKAAGINAVAVTFPSFSSLIPHLPTAQFDMSLTGVLLVVGAIGSFAGARLSSVYLPSDKIKQMFGILIVAMTLYKIYTMLR
ncbi:sulfite exporter TauE/SafE family protein [Azotosporobacter soli]|uniref:sulfite exporter TauE/SafE family protein n=1 Tax=Azotosporobacter soli TaxID=3055040 RepID=UPI0031FE7EB1